VVFLVQDGPHNVSCFSIAKLGFEAFADDHVSPMADARLKFLNATVCHYIIAAPATGARKLNYTTRYPSTRGQRWATLTRRTRKRVFKTVQRHARKQPLDVPVQKTTLQLFVGKLDKQSIIQTSCSSTGLCRTGSF